MLMYNNKEVLRVVAVMEIIHGKTSNYMVRRTFSLVCSGCGKKQRMNDILENFELFLNYQFVYDTVTKKNRDSSVGIALGYGLDDRGSKVRFPTGLGISLFTTTFRTALGPTQPLIQWVPGALSLGIKRPGREAYHSPNLVPRSKNEWSYTSTPQYAFMAWCSAKAQGHIYYYYYYYYYYYLGRGVKLTTHLLLVPRSRMSGALPPFPDTPLWRGTQLKDRNFALTFNLGLHPGRPICSHSLYRPSYPRQMQIENR
jgi:hypothetical protein